MPRTKNYPRTGAKPECWNPKASICLYGRVFDNWDHAFNTAKVHGYNGSAFRLQSKYFREHPASWVDLIKKLSRKEVAKSKIFANNAERGHWTKMNEMSGIVEAIDKRKAEIRALQQLDNEED